VRNRRCDEVRPNELDYYVRTVTFKLYSGRSVTGDCLDVQAPYGTVERGRLQPYSVHLQELVNCGLPVTAAAGTIREAWSRETQDWTDDEVDSGQSGHEYEDEDDNADEADHNDDDIMQDSDNHGEFIMSLQNTSN